MTRTSLPSSWCAALTAVALSAAPISCKDEPKKEESAAAVEDAKDEPDAKDGSSGGGSDKDSTGLADKARAAVAVIAGPRDIEPSYPAELDKLLDLVPADAETFFIVRDAGALVHGALAYAEAQKASMRALAGEMAKTDPGDADDVREALDMLDKIGAELEASGIDLSAGLVFAKRKGADPRGVMVYGSAKADAFPTMLTALGSATDEIPKDCAVVGSAAGYSVCAKNDIGTYTPGSKAKDYRAKLAAKLPGIDLERANVLAFVVDDGEEVPFVVETGQGMAHVAFAVPSAREELAKFLQASKAPALGLIGPGQPFLWAQMSASALASQAGSAPPMAQGFAKSLTGELVIGGVGNIRGFAIGLGVSDPTPTAGLLSLASLGLGEVPKKLEDGTELAVAMKTVKTATASVQAIHAELTGGKQQKIVDGMGYESEVYAFAAGKLAALTFGAGEDVVAAVADYAGTAPSDELLDALPSPLAKALRDGKAVAAVHAPFDALQSAAAQTMLELILDQIPRKDMGKTDPKVAGKVALDAMAPLSSASMWITDVDTGPVFHVALQGFGVVGTDEGKAAFDALSEVGGGADRHATYAKLASTYASSPRSASYKARAGDMGDPMGSLFVLSAMGAAAGALFYFGRTDGTLEGPIAVEAPIDAAEPTAPPAP